MMVLFLIITVIYIKIFAVDWGIVGALYLGFGVFYNRISDCYNKKPEFYWTPLLIYVIFNKFQSRGAIPDKMKDRINLLKYVILSTE